MRRPYEACASCRFFFFFFFWGLFKKSSTTINKVDIQLHGNKTTQHNNNIKVNKTNKNNNE
jgi:hypothetical protein